MSCYHTSSSAIQEEHHPSEHILSRLRANLLTSAAEVVVHIHIFARPLATYSIHSHPPCAFVKSTARDMSAAMIILKRTLESIVDPQPVDIASSTGRLASLRRAPKPVVNG
ncbi:hypothetical protein CVT24_013057 [Panaeolus cyanescens]|uniref:Uncharacterized protein n=1 Tax=Panaeolus cyanescens TaxID=181874 RepID=A0A409YUS7_9AGAR|nr:hypothetical protein CVT24_013057 [Panaeolus cyanescens]